VELQRELLLADLPRECNVLIRSWAAVEGMNANAKLALRKARGFRTYEVLETALYHEMGHLPEPASATHRFC
jgi:hypothetical protein